MKATVIGGGVAGLVTAYRLSQAGWEVAVHERDARLGGLASTFMYEGLSPERYYHFICRPDHPYLELIDELGLAPKLHWQPTRMGYIYEGRYYPFGSPWSLLRFGPLSLASRVRFGLHALQARGMTGWAELDDVTAHDWLVEHEGRQVYEVVWRPLLELKFGDEAESISAAWIWARINRVANSREGVMLRERLGYLEGGTQTLIDTLTERIEAAGGSVTSGTAVERILIAQGKVTGVRLASGVEESADAVVSTVAPSQLLQMAPELPEPFATTLGDVGYYGVACWLLVASETLSPDFWLNVHDSRASFPGVIQYTNLNPMPELGGRHLLYIPYYMSQSDPRFVMSREEWLPTLRAELDAIRPGFSAKVESWQLFRDPYAQPLFRAGFHRRFSSLEQPGTPVSGLFRTDMSQTYPDDRSLVNAIAKAGDAARAVMS